MAFAAFLYLAVFAVLWLLRTFPILQIGLSENVVLNLLVNTPDGTSPMAQAQKISDSLNTNNIKHVISSVHIDDTKTNVSIVLKNHKDNDFAFIDKLCQADPEIEIDYYRH